MKLSTLILSLLLLSFTSCSSSVKNEVEEDRYNLSPMISKDEMIDRISLALNKIEGITDNQREEIRDIHAQVMTDSWEINQGIRSNKVLLFKYLSKSQVDEKKVRYVKKAIIKLYKKKLDLMLKSFDKVRKAMGKDSAKLFQSKEFMMMHSPARR